MVRIGTNRFLLLLGAFAVATSTACARNAATPAAEKPAAAAAAPVPAAPATASHAFNGIVKTVDAAHRKLSVANENIPGWMGAMTMSYAVSNPEVFTSIKAGDHITATVYDGDFQTLYDVRIDSGAGKAPSR